MTTPRKAFGWEKLARAFLEAGSMWLTADTITKRTGVPQPARRVHDLKKKGIEIDAKFFDRAQGIYEYRLAPGQAQKVRDLLADAAADAKPEPEEFPTDLFGGTAPAKSTSHHEYEDAA